MHQSVRARDRQKRPQQPCKKHRSTDVISKNILESMSEKGREALSERRSEETAERRNKRKVVSIQTHEVRLEDSRRIGKKHTRRKANVKKVRRQTVQTKKVQPNMEAIARKKERTKRKIIKRRAKKIVSFAARHGIDPTGLIASILPDTETGHLPVSKYQQMALAS